MIRVWFRKDTVPKRGPRLAAAPTAITGLEENSDAVCEALESAKVAADEITWLSANSFHASNLDELDVLLDLRSAFLPFERAAPSAADPEKKNNVAFELEL